MKEYINKRKSVRNYRDEKLAQEVLDEIQSRIAKLTPLFENSTYEISIIDKVSGMFSVKAPHYLAFYAAEEAGYLENIGFVGQQLSLYLNSLGIGSCWLGAAKSSEKTPDKHFVICLALGYPSESLFREEQDFKRKDINKVSNVVNDISKAAALAPSAVNFQDWYFYQQDTMIHCYQQKVDFLKARLLGKTMGKIDLGIAMCHIALMLTTYEIIEFAQAPDLEGYQYFRSFLLERNTDA